jgi:dipeptidase
LGNRICAHAANPLARKATQSTASLAARLKKRSQTYWATGTSSPCTSIFKPLWLEGDVLPDIGPVPGAAYEPESLWWRHEALHREVLQEFQSRREAFSAERDVLEQGFLREADELEKRWLQGTAETGAASGEVMPMSFCLTKKSFEEADEAEARWLERISTLPTHRKNGFIYRRFWAAQNRSASMTIR